MRFVRQAQGDDIVRRWLVLGAVLFATAAVAQAPQQLWGLIYNLVAPVLSDKQSAPWQGNSSGQMRVDGLPTGPCSDSLDFTDACNSQYMGVL